jgi:TRAP-type C4-dicarboxylate transport system permease small subunit
MTYIIDRTVKSLELINSMLGRYIGWIILVISLFVGYDTVMRYVFNSPNEWVQEISVYGFGFFVLLGGGYVQLCKSHIRTDVISANLSPKLQNYLNIFYFIPAAIFVITMLIVGWDIFWMALTQNQKRAGILMWPLWPYLFAIPVGSALALLQLLADLLKDIKTAFPKNHQGK